MSTEPGNLADLLQFHPACAPVIHNLGDLASASAYGAYQTSLDAAWAPAREAATGGHPTPACAPVGSEPEATTCDLGAVTPPAPAALEPETLRRTLEAFKTAWAEAKTIADRATEMRTENGRLRVENLRMATALRAAELFLRTLGGLDSEPAAEVATACRAAMMPSAGEAQAPAKLGSDPKPHMRAAARREPNPRTKR